MFWNRKKRSTVHVEFVDADTGAHFGQTDISPDQLPGSFEAETTMHLGEQDFLVVSAAPMTAVEFRASGRLRLVLRRVKSEKINPGELLFSVADDLRHAADAGGRNDEDREERPRAS